MNEKLVRDKNDLTVNMVRIIKLVPLEMSKMAIAEKLGMSFSAVSADMREMYIIFSVKTVVGLAMRSVKFGYFIVIVER
jgi:hypothetical protein